MAIAVEALPEVASAAEGGSAAAGGEGAAAARAPRARRAGQFTAPASGVAAARAAYSRVATPGATAQTITKLIWAVAIGLIVLQIAAEATGQQWRFSLPTEGKRPVKEPYRPLYAGQVSTAMPGFPVSVVGPGAPTPGLTTGAGTGLVTP